ncbi:MAG: orotidine-5'-phosphate decarboxylase [Oscillospiraceae bacterium]|nr:orotidine-5'-phosphate decarboxylase [Oscillospiraceae bacterium]
MAIDVLQDKIRKMKNPTMLSLDPSQDVVPDCVLQEGFSAYGETPQGLSHAYLTFCRNLLDALRDTVPAVKLQAACFEVLGSSGTAVLQELCVMARERGYYVVMDSMRGELPHIAALYAEAVFGSVKIGEKHYSPYPCDGLTVNGYLGSDAVKPFLPFCKDAGKNVFLLVRTPNRSAREVQDLISGDRVVHTAMADLAMRWSTDLFAKSGYSEIGAVMGATDPQLLAAMRRKYDQLFFLVAGYGAQGGTAKNVAGAFDQFGHGAIVTASRSLIGAWKRAETDGRDYAEQAQAAAEKMKRDIQKYVTVI